MDVGRIAAAANVVLSWLYADFAGGGGSAYRAAAMLSLAMLARAFGRKPSGRRAFGLSLVGAALVEPLAACDLSFGLSVAATAGIMLWSAPSVVASETPHPVGLRQRMLGWLYVGARATVAAHLACLPLLLSMSSEVPLLSVAANVLAAPVGELAALPVCLVHAVLWWWEPVEQGAAALGSGALQIVRAIAHARRSWRPDVSPPASYTLASECSGDRGLVAVWARPARRSYFASAALALLVGLEVQAMRAGAPTDELRITALDVGQGDAIVVDLPDGRVMLIDGGGLVGSSDSTPANGWCSRCCGIGADARSTSRCSATPTPITTAVGSLRSSGCRSMRSGCRASPPPPVPRERWHVRSL